MNSFIFQQSSKYQKILLNHYFISDDRRWIIRVTGESKAIVITGDEKAFSIYAVKYKDRYYSAMNHKDDWNVENAYFYFGGHKFDFRDRLMIEDV